MKYSILKKLKINRPTITLTSLLFMLAGPTSAWADGSWTSGGCDVILSGGTLTVSKSATGNGAMADYSSTSVSPWDSEWETITSVVIEDGVTSIGERAFRYLTKVTTVSLGSDLTTIGNSAFELCNGLTSVTIPASVTSIGTKAFNNCSKLESITVDASNANYASEDGVLLNKAKETLIQYPGGKSGSYTIPASVTNIDDYAFNACENLETVSFGNGVTRIGNYAFQNCKNLTTISFGSGLKTILLGTFQGCTSLSSVNLPASLTNIGSEAFAGCTNLATATLNSNPNIAGGKSPAFYNNTTVTMNLTATVGAGGEYWMTFYNKNHNFQVPATGTRIFKAELSDDKLTIRELTTDKIVTEGKAVILKSTTASITLTRTTSDSSNDFSDNSLSGVDKSKGKDVTDDPSTTYALNSGAQGVGFYKVLTGNTIGVGNAYVTSTSTSDFLPLVVVTSGNCGDTSKKGGADVTWNYDTTTKTLTISGTGPMMYYGSALGSDSKYHSTAPWSHLDSEIQKVIVGDGVTYIGSYAFAYCTALTSVSLPSSVSALGDYVCYSSNVTRIDIPSTTAAATLGEDGFDCCPAALQIAVPSTLLGTYQTADNWSTYAAKLVGVLSEATGFGTGFATGNYEYTRTFKCGVASTVCLPFGLDATQAASIGKFYSFAGIDKTGQKWEVIMEEATNKVSTDLTANLPYLFVPYIFDGKSKGDAVTFTLSGSVSTPGEASDSDWTEPGTTNKWTFKGIYVDWTWSFDPDNIYGFAAQSYDGSSYTVNPGDFVKVGSGASIAPFRAYLEYTAGNTNAPRRGAAENLPSRMTVRLVNADGETTSLENVQLSSQGHTLKERTFNVQCDNSWFTLDGRKLDKQPTQRGLYIVDGKKVVIK